jgi:hypothetical protein
MVTLKLASRSDGKFRQEGSKGLRVAALEYDDVPLHPFQAGSAVGW